MAETRSAQPIPSADAKLAWVASQVADWLEQTLPNEGAHRDAVALLRAYASNVPGSLDRALHFCDALGFSSAELDLLILAGLSEEHEGFAALFRMIHPRGEPRPTVGLAAQIFCHSLEERRRLRALLQSGPAARCRVLHTKGDEPIFERSITLADALWPVLRGGDAWPNEVTRLESPIVIAGLSDWLNTRSVKSARAALSAGDPCTVLVIADSEDTAAQRAAALVESARLRFARIAWGPTRAALADAESVVGLHVLARQIVPVIVAPPADGSGSGDLPCFNAHPGPVVIAARAGTAALHALRPIITVHAEPLSRAGRVELWTSFLPNLAEHAEILAARYPVEPMTAQEVALDVEYRRRLEKRPMTLDDVADAVRARVSATLTSGVSLVRPTATWDSLVLPPRAHAQVKEASDRLLHQRRVLDEWGFLSGRTGSRGVRMLFAGPPGTGKTLSAEVVANALGLDLLVIDVSRVVSKWIGETEKNLSTIFDLAERTPAVLLFDEADALFGKRTEVADAHDRYANLETAYLLSRIERFEGLVVLSTNYRQNVDAAFLRRMEFVVTFEEPGIDDRERLWRCHLPPKAPTARDVDVQELAALYPLVGGYIRNAAVGAAFLAAAEGEPIARSHFFRAIQREYEKAGRPFPGAPSA